MLNFFSICQYSAKALSCGNRFNFCCVIFGITLLLAFKIKFRNEKNSENPLNWAFHKYISTFNKLLFPFLITVTFILYCPYGWCWGFLLLLRCIWQNRKSSCFFCQRLLQVLIWYFTKFKTESSVKCRLAQLNLVQKWQFNMKLYSELSQRMGTEKNETGMYNNLINSGSLMGAQMIHSYLLGVLDCHTYAIFWFTRKKTLQSTIQ